VDSNKFEGIYTCKSTRFACSSFICCCVQIMQLCTYEQATITSKSWLIYSGAVRTIIGRPISVFTYHKNNLFQKKWIKQNTNVWISPPQLSVCLRHCSCEPTSYDFPKVVFAVRKKRHELLTCTLCRLDQYSFWSQLYDHEVPFVYVILIGFQAHVLPNDVKSILDGTYWETR
jgi:hypothetical protein